MVMAPRRANVVRVQQGGFNRSRGESPRIHASLAPLVISQLGMVKLGVVLVPQASMWLVTDSPIVRNVSLGERSIAAAGSIATSVSLDILPLTPER